MMPTLIPRVEAGLEPSRGAVLGEWMGRSKTVFNASGFGQDLFLPSERGGLFDPSKYGDYILTPDRIPPQRTFNPVIIFFTGRRGQGKTLAGRAVAEMQDIRYRVAGIPLARSPEETLDGKASATWKIISNIWMDNASLFHPKVFDATEEIDGFDGLVHFPPWAYQMWALFDEIGDIADSMRANSKINLGLGATVHQLRKRRMEGCLTSQFPQETSYRLLRQVDLFIICEKHLDGAAIECFVFDYWGQWTGKNYRKPFPPSIGDHDWEVGLYNLKPLWTRYNSWEVVPPVWALRRHEIIAQQYSFGADTAKTGAPEGTSPKPVLTTASDLAGVLTRRFMAREFDVGAALSVAKQMEKGIEGLPDLVTWLESNGWLVNKDGRKYYARKAGA